MNRKRKLFFYGDHFEMFYDSLDKVVQHKILWTFKLIEVLERIPERFLKSIRGSEGLFEIRVQQRNNIFRIFCFFDQDRVVVVNGFQKKSRKTPNGEIERAERLKKAYHEHRK